MKSGFLPATKTEMNALGWDRPDVVLVTGDAYVDHPSFPAALIGRVLEAAGFRVCILARPDVRKPETISEFGIPRLFFGVTAGALDSMVANFTPLKKRRSDDPYAPGGKGGGRPDRAVTVYCNMIRKVYGNRAFIVAGGIEASLRKFAHYDFWSDSVRRPLLMDCGANLIVHGMGEGPIVEIARVMAGQSRDGLRPLPRKIRWPGRSAAGLSQVQDAELRLSARGAHGPPMQDGSALTLQTNMADSPSVGLAHVRTSGAGILEMLSGVVYRTPKREAHPADSVGLPSAEEVARDPMTQAKAHRMWEQNRDKILWQESGGMRVLVNPPWIPTSAELDRIYALPFTREAHPMHGKAKIPALDTVQFGVTSHRGCFGGCAFCAISAHQGKTVVSRSKASILAEIGHIAGMRAFRGTISDVGGPTANMYGLGCKAAKPCSRPSCMWPEKCAKMNADQRSYLDLLKAASRVPGVKHLFVSTGVRMDLALSCDPLINALALEHTSGHLKVAPEHVSADVLKLMRKPSNDSFESFVTKHRQLSRRAGKEQYVIPYFIAAHPGCTMEHMKDLAGFLKRERIIVEQCQIFTPTPGTASTVMYATGLDPATLKPVFVERDPRRKEQQKALILHHLPGRSRY